MIVHRAHAAYAATALQIDEGALIERYTALIDRCARRLATRVGDPDLYDEVWSAGALGLVEAAHRFDPAQDVRFETFVEHRVRGAMLDEMRKLQHLPRRLRNDLGKLAAAQKKLEQELGRDATTEELAEVLEVDIQTVAEMEALQQPHIPLANEIPVASAEIPADEQLALHEQQALLAKAIATLPERLQILLSLIYVEEFTYKECAKILQVSEPRICQLHKEALM